MLTTAIKNALLDQIKIGLNDAYLIEDPSLTIALGSTRTAVASLSVTYPTYHDLVWDSASVSKVITTNSPNNSNPINFSVKALESPNRLVIVDNSDVAVCIFELATPVPSYTVAGPYYVRQLSLEITEV